MKTIEEYEKEIKGYKCRMSHPVDKGFTRIESYPHADGWVVKIPISQGYRIERRWIYGVCSICGYQNSLAKLRDRAGKNQTAGQKPPPFCVECYRTMSLWSDLFPESPANWSVEAQNNARSTYVCANDVCEAYLAVNNGR